MNISPSGKAEQVEGETLIQAQAAAGRLGRHEQRGQAGKPQRRGSQNSVPRSAPRRAAWSKTFGLIAGLHLCPRQPLAA